MSNLCHSHENPALNEAEWAGLHLLCSVFVIPAKPVLSKVEGAGIHFFGMVQIAQILGNIDFWLHSGWQPQIRRIWGWLRRFWSFAIPKLRLRLPPRIEPCHFFVFSLCPLWLILCYQSNVFCHACFNESISASITVFPSSAFMTSVFCSVTLPICPNGKPSISFAKAS